MSENTTTLPQVKNGLGSDGSLGEGYLPQRSPRPDIPPLNLIRSAQENYEEVATTPALKQGLESFKVGGMLTDVPLETENSMGGTSQVRTRANMDNVDPNTQDVLRNINLKMNEIIDKQRVSETGDKIEFEYKDTADIKTELAELYAYSEIREIRRYQKRYLQKRREEGRPWLSMDEEEQAEEIQTWLSDMECVSEQRRMVAATNILLVLQGSMAENLTGDEQLNSAKKGAHLVFEQGTFPICLDLMCSAIWRGLHGEKLDGGRGSLNGSSTSVSNSGADGPLIRGSSRGNVKDTVNSKSNAANQAVRLHANIIYTLIALCDHEEEIREMRKTLHSTNAPNGQNYISFMFQTISLYADARRMYLPVKKALLLTWRLILVCCGGLEEQRQMKHEMRKKAGLRSYNGRTKARQTEYSMHYTSSMSRRFGALIAADLEALDTRHAELYSQNLDRSAVPPALQESIDTMKDHLYKSLAEHQIEQERDLERLRMRDHLKYEKELRKTQEARQRASDMEVLYATLLPRLPQMIVSILKILLAAISGAQEIQQMQQSQQNISHQGSKRDSRIDIMMEVEETGADGAHNDVTQTPETTTATDADEKSPPLFKEPAIGSGKHGSGTEGGDRRIERTESGDSLDSHADDSVLSHSLFMFVERMRHKEVLCKAVSAILILLLKHLKVNHVYQFEFLGQILTDANCILLILKHLNQSSATILTVTPIIEEFELFSEKNVGASLGKLNLPTTPRGLEDCLQPRASYRNYFTLVSLLKVMQKLTKRKPLRTMIMIQARGPLILKRYRNIQNNTMQLTILKLYKSMSRMLGRKWRNCNMMLVSAIYHQVPHSMHDDWAYSSDAESNKGLQVDEQALRVAVQSFNQRYYSHGQMGEGGASSKGSNSSLSTTGVSGSGSASVRDPNTTAALLTAQVNDDDPDDHSVLHAHLQRASRNTVEALYGRTLGGPGDMPPEMSEAELEYQFETWLSRRRDLSCYL
eukprot:Clim_evm25s243 gene=Clim_evmTU25s243